MDNREAEVWVQGKDDAGGDYEFYGTVYFDEEEGFPQEIVLRTIQGEKRYVLRP